MKTSHTIVQVVPLIRVIPTLAVLDYEVPNSIAVQPGMVVRIPFRRQTIDGIVWKLDASLGERKRKPVERVTEAALSSTQLALMQWLHQETNTPLNVVGRLFTPTVTRLTRAVQDQVSARRLVLCATLPAHEQVISSWVQQLLRTQEHVLILCPSQAYVRLWQEKLPETQTTVLQRELSAVGRKRAHAELSAKRFFLTTHSGLYSPLPHLHRVIIDLADDPGYFAFEQAPRVDLRQVAEKLAALNGAILVGCARYVNPEVAALFPNTVTKSIGAQAAVQILDRSTEPPAMRGAIIPAHLLERLASTRTLWLHNRLNESRKYVCKDCGAPVACPNCQTPLQVQSVQPVQLWCPKDRTRLLGPAACSVCHSAAFVQRGYGLLHTAREIRAVEPDVSVVSKLQRTLPKTLHVVATTAIAAHIQQRFEAAVVVQPDSLLTSGQYRSEENFLDLLALVRQFVAPTGTVYIPTFQPDHQTLQFLQDLGAWLQKTKAERAQLLYPPEGTLVTLGRRLRLQETAVQPLPAAALPADIISQTGENQWVLRCSKAARPKLLQFLRKTLEPTWEATVDPPHIDS